MAARQFSGKRPENLGYTIKMLLAYMGRHKFMLLIVALLVTVSAAANLLGTYMIRPIINNLADGQISSLIRGVAVTALIYVVGALSAYGYTQTMVKAAQQVLFDIRRDLFAHLQTLPLKFFDTNRHGDVMSYFTNDVDTISDALNNSFTMMIQSFIQIASVYPELEAVFSGSHRICRHVPVYPVQRGQEQKILFPPAGKSWRPGRLYRGNGQRAEGG